MKQLLHVLALAGMVGAGIPGEAGGEGPATAPEIESASGVLLMGTHPSPAATQKALTDLLDSASRISSTAGLPVPAQGRLDSALALYRGGGFLEPETVATVHQAYEAVTGGHAFVFPESVGSVEDARDYGRGQIQRALAALEAGQSREAVREVLGFVLLVTTPRTCD